MPSEKISPKRMLALLRKVGGHRGRSGRREMSGDIRRPVEERPVGFGDQVTIDKAKEVCHLKLKDPRVKKFLGAKDPGNDLQDFTFAAARWGKEHAILVVRSKNANGVRPYALVRHPKVEPTKRIEPDDDIRVIHLHYAQTPKVGKPRTMRVSEKILYHAVDVTNYVELVRIRTTPRTLIMAVCKKMPPTSTEVLSDCAQFAIDVINELSRCTHNIDSDNMSTTEYDGIIRMLPKFIHVKDGTVGESEVESRNVHVRSNESQEVLSRR